MRLGLSLSLASTTSSMALLTGLVGYADFSVGAGDYTTYPTTTSLPTGTTITRSGHATYFDALGNLQYAPNNMVIRSDMSGAVATDNVELLTNPNAGWVLTNAGGSTTTNNSGTLTMVGDGTNTTSADYQFTGLTSGRTYNLSFTLASAGVLFSAGTTQGATNIQASVTAANYASNIYGMRLVASGTTMWVRFSRSGALTNVVSNISLKWAGSLPTGWSSLGGVVGIAQFVQSVTTDGGMPAIVARLYGTQIVNGSVNAIEFGSRLDAPVALGQYWLASYYAKTVSAPTPNPRTFTISVSGYIGGGFNEALLNNATTITGTLTRFYGRGQVASGNTTTVGSIFYTYLFAGDTLDHTFEIAGPQLELVTAAQTQPGPFVLTTGSAYYGPRFSQVFSQVGTENAVYPLVESTSATNGIHYSATAGVAGTIGSTGSWPGLASGFQWGEGNNAGLTRTVSYPIVNGMQVTRLRIYGTTNASNYTIYFDATSTISAAQNDVW